VSVAIFTVVMVSSTELFVSALRQMRVIEAMSSVHEDSRHVMETMARVVREGHFQFDVPEGVAFMLSDDRGGLVAFRMQKEGCPSGSDACVQIGKAASEEDPLEWASLTGEDVTAIAFDVVTAPAQDPFLPFGENEDRPTTQPVAMIHLVLRGAGIDSEGIRTMESQTTIVSRNYRQ
jgi:Tfp pilus assembly protein PilW